MKEIDLSIVIPSFNGEGLLAANLPKIVNIFPKQEIIVVDDGSSDKTQELLAIKFPKVKVITNKQNLGFSSATNKGIFASKTKLVFLLNNDCYPKNNFLNYILPYFQDADTFAVSCAEDKNGVVRGRGIGGFKKGLFYHKPGKLNKNNTLWVFGASTIYNKQIFERLGGFDENFNPFYWEDFDLSYRALKSGYKIYFKEKAIVYHEQSSTINKYYSDNQIQQISFRNQLFTCWKNITDNNLLINHIFWLPYHLTVTNIKTKGTFLSGFIMALIKIGKIIKERKNNRFIYADKEVLTPFQKELSLK